MWGAGGEEHPVGVASEGHVVVAHVASVRGRGFSNGSRVTDEGVVQSGGTATEGVGATEDSALLGGPLEVVDEGGMLGDKGTDGDVEGMVKDAEDCEFWSVDEVGDGGRDRRGWFRRRAARALHDGMATTGRVFSARVVATCCR